MGAIPLAKAFQEETDDSVSTETLVQRVKEGDTRAFETLYRRLVGRIYALCLNGPGPTESGGVDPGCLRSGLGADG